MSKIELWTGSSQVMNVFFVFVFWEPMPLRCIEGTVWGGGGCTANALELLQPCVEPPMYPDVIEGCTSIGPESILLSRRWSDIGAIHLRCQTCHQYSILTHWSLECNNYNRIVNQFISCYEGFFFFWEPMPLRCIDGMVWGGGGCTANALELTPPCVEPPMHPDVIEGCTSIGPESILLSRRWPDIGAIHLRCQTCHQYSILTHWSIVCNNYNRIVNQIISGYECFGGFFWEPVPLRCIEGTGVGRRWLHC